MTAIPRHHAIRVTLDLVPRPVQQSARLARAIADSSRNIRRQFALGRRRIDAITSVMQGTRPQVNTLAVLMERSQAERASHLRAPLALKLIIRQQHAVVALEIRAILSVEGDLHLDKRLTFVARTVSLVVVGVSLTKTAQTLSTNLYF